MLFNMKNLRNKIEYVSNHINTLREQRSNNQLLRAFGAKAAYEYAQEIIDSNNSEILQKVNLILSFAGDEGGIPYIEGIRTLLKELKEDLSK